MTGTRDCAKAGAVQRAASISSVRFISLAPAGQNLQRREATLHARVDHVRDTVTRPRAASARQVGKLVLVAEVATQVVGLLGDQVADACTDERQNANRRTQ